MIDQLPKNELERYKLIFENVSDIVTFLDTSGRIVDVNSQVKNILGYEKDEIIGKFFFKLPMLDLKKLTGIFSLFKDSLKTGKVKNNIEVSLRSKTGEDMIFEVNTSFLKEEGKIVGVINIFRDITSNKKSFELLKKSSFNLKERVKEINTLYTINRIIAGNASSLDDIFQEIIDILPMGFQFPELVSARITYKSKEYHSKNFSESKIVLSKDFKLEDKNFGKIDVYYSEDTKLESGQNDYFLEEEFSLLDGIADDITQYLIRVEIENELKNNELWLKSVLENVTDAVFILDAEYKIISWNDGCIKLFGYTKEESYDVKLNELLERDFLEDLSKDEDDIFFSTNQEILGKKKNGEKTFTEVSFDKWEVNSKKFITIVARDISQKIKSKKELESKDRILVTLTEVSESLLKGGNWEDNISNLLEKLLVAVDVSRVYIFENFEEEGTLFGKQTFEVTREGIESFMDDSSLQKFNYKSNSFNLFLSKLSSNNTISGLVEYFPKPERDIFESQGIKSIALIPIFVKDYWWGVIGFDDCEKKREWSYTVIQSLKATASILGAAIQYSDYTKQIADINKKLASNNVELEKFNRVMVGREVKMAELKNKIRQLENEN